MLLFRIINHNTRGINEKRNLSLKQATVIDVILDFFTSDKKILLPRIRKKIVNKFDEEGTKLV